MLTPASAAAALWALAALALPPATPAAPPTPPPSSPQAPPPEVITTHGRLRGLRAPPPPGSGLGPVTQFLGVPYAAPPTGPRRFQPPEPPDAWPGVRDARRPPPACPQGPDDNIPAAENMAADNVAAAADNMAAAENMAAAVGAQSEDCLYLNVYVPAGQDGGGDGGESHGLRASSAYSWEPRSFAYL